MTKASIPTRVPPKWDPLKFEQMNEPFNVRVEKIKGSTRQEIPLPASESGPGGVGWSKDQVRDLPGWIINDWSGGGNYAFSIVDSSTPPQMMEWTAFYSPNEFPEKIPPTLQAGTLPVVSAPQTVSPTPTPIQGRPMATFPGGALPSGSMYVQHQPQPQPAPMPPPPTAHYYPPQPAYVPACYQDQVWRRLPDGRIQTGIRTRCY